jgi:hypothetical protein
VRWPETPSDLFDILHEWWGIGTYDDAVKNETPWYKIRQTEAGKIKRQMTKRKVAMRELFIAAMYCRAQGKIIRESWQLFEHIPDALIASRNARAVHSFKAIQEQQISAVSQAIRYDQPEWAERLMRATGEVRIKETLEEWKQWRNANMPRGARG